MTKQAITQTVRQILATWQPDISGIAPEGIWGREVTIIVTTFERPMCVLRLLQSIRRYYPNLAILVSDSSRPPLFPVERYLPANITWLALPPDRGHTVGAGRNYLVERVTTPYFFLCDDDQIFTAYTNLEAMYQFLERQHYDLVGGCQGKGDYGTAIFEQIGDVVYQRSYGCYESIEPGVVRCDRVSNTFLARTAAVKGVLWEPRVYANEHAEFFLRASRGQLKIAQMSRVHVDHDRCCEQATPFIGRLFDRLRLHRDWEYHRLMVNADNFLGLRSKQAKALEQKYCFEKNGIKAIVSTYNPADKRKLVELLEQ